MKAVFDKDTAYAFSMGKSSSNIQAIENFIKTRLVQLEKAGRTTEGEATQWNQGRRQELGDWLDQINDAPNVAVRLAREKAKDLKGQQR